VGINKKGHTNKFIQGIHVFADYVSARVYKQILKLHT